jgi:hypothetical protein
MLLGSPAQEECVELHMKVAGGSPDGTGGGADALAESVGGSDAVLLYGCLRPGVMFTGVTRSKECLSCGSPSGL